MEKIINILIGIALIFMIYTLIHINFYLKQEDLNHDGIVNSADLLYLKKYLLERSGCP